MLLLSLQGDCDRQGSREVQGARRRALSGAQQDELRGGIAQGERKTGLAREFGISRETVYCYLRP